MTALILALDCGSTHFKAALFDQTLRRLGEHQAALAYRIQERERVQFDPEETWRLATDLIRQTCREAGVNPETVQRLAITSQAQTFMLATATGRPLTPFFSWMDTRAGQEAAWLRQMFGADFHQHCSFPQPVAGMQASLLLWVYRHCAHVFAPTTILLTLPGFIITRCGAESATDTNLAAMSGLYSLPAGAWRETVVQACGLTPRQLPRLLPCGQPVALSRSARLPLNRDLKIVLAGNDQSAGAVGIGCAANSLLVTLGTAPVVYRRAGQQAGPYTPAGCWGPYPAGGYYELATRRAGTLALDWARQHLMPGRDLNKFNEAAEQARQKRSAAADPESEPLFFPEALHTQRAWHGVPDVNRRALAVFEGLSFTLRQLILDELRIAPPLPDILVTGGGSRSALWLELLADILKARVRRVAGDALLGAARLAADQPADLPAQAASGTAGWIQPQAPAFYEALYHRWLNQQSRSAPERQS